MPRPASLASIPHHLLDLAEAMNTLDEFTIPCESRKEAFSIRFRLYAVRQAIRREKLTPLYPGFDSCQFLIDDNCVKLVKPEKAPGFSRVIEAVERQLYSRPRLPPTELHKPEPESDPTIDMEMEDAILTYLYPEGKENH